MDTITRIGLIELVNGQRGATAVSIVTATEPKMRKTGNPLFGRVVLHAKRNGMLGANYENAVNNRRVAEATVAGEPEVDTFNALALWNGKGEHIGRYFARHVDTNRVYIVFYPRHDEVGHPTTKPKVYRDRFSGVELEADEVVPHLIASGSSKRQEVERPVPWRTIAIENITAIQIGGQAFNVVD